MTATLAEVAREAGVSIATASRALNNSASVSDGAYQRVCDAATRLAYVRQRAPAATVRRGPGAVAVVVHTEHRRLFGDAFYHRLITAAGAELALCDVPLLVVSVTAASLPTVGRYLHGGHVDGVIVVGDHGPHPLAGSLPAAGLPVAVIGRPLGPSRAPYFDADNRGSARHGVEHLLGAGRRGIVHVAGPPDLAAGADRLAGYRDALRGAHLPASPVAYGDFTPAAGAYAMELLLHQRPRLDAVFVASDAMAAGALRALARTGRRVPDDVAVVGFDDDPVALQVSPALTTVRQPIEELGRLAVRRLLRGTGAVEPGPAATVLPTSLVVRGTA